MARKSTTSTRRRKAPAPAVSTLSSADLPKALTLSILSGARDMLAADTIRSFGTWPTDVAAKLNLGASVVQGLVEPELRITVGKYFGLAEVHNLKAVFEAATGGGLGAFSRSAGIKIVNDTIARLAK